MRAPRRPQVPGHPFYTPVKMGVRGNRERKRKAQPQRFPYERSPRRFFGFFLIAQKETRRPQRRNLLQRRKNQTAGG